jgi:hypothetical protein
MKKTQFIFDIALIIIALLSSLVFFNFIFGIHTNLKSIFKIFVTFLVFMYFLYEKTKNVIIHVYPKYFVFFNAINKFFDKLFKTLNKSIGNTSLGPNLSIETSQLLFLLLLLTILYIL